MKSMKALTASQMQALDRKAIQDYGIPSLLLMENAGRGIAEIVCRISKGKRVVVFAGKGNNGGDGLVAARHLFNRGYSVKVLLLGEPGRLKADAALNFKIISRMGIPWEEAGEKTPESALSAAAINAEIILDALFGVGLNTEIGGVYKKAVEAINKSNRTVLAVDIPSGLDADTGEILGCAVRAKVTAALGCPKRGFFQGRGPEYTGRICVVDISLPRQEVRKACGDTNP